MRSVLYFALVAGLAARPLVAEELFVDVAADAGLDFVHFNGMSGELYFPEMMGSGVALFDFDNDGDLDVYLVQGHMLGDGKTLADAIFPPAHDGPFSDQLYRNDSDHGNLRFTNVTAESGIDARGYGMGVAIADIDNDGWQDIYVTNYSHNQMYRNNGDGSFSDITASAGVDDPRWSVSASFFDYDKDGLLDLYVGNYVKHSYEHRRICKMSNKQSDYCGPLIGQGYKDSLFHNLGNGRFENVSEKSGIERAWGGALGVVAADFDGDSWTDIYVANDGIANLLWINDGKGGFHNSALLAGVAVNKDGRAEASMGLDAADFDGDGDEDLFMTHLTGETNTLYANNGNGWFNDNTIETGLTSNSFPYTGFGTFWFDVENDGDLDLLMVNGAVKIIDRQAAAGDLYPLKQPNQLYLNDGTGKYQEVTAQAGAVFKLSEVSRGLAIGDIDNDGDSDALISNNSGPARLLINQQGQNGNWIGVILVDQKRPTTGSQVAMIAGDRKPVWRRSHTDGSYASANDPRVIFGLDGSDVPVTIVVRWPDGSLEKWTGLDQREYHRLEKGGGNATTMPAK